MYKVLILGTIILLTSCSRPLPPSDFRKVIILENDPPKHWKLTYKVLDSGEVREARSKRCPTWDVFKVGERYVLNINDRRCTVTETAKKVS